MRAAPSCLAGIALVALAFPMRAQQAARPDTAFDCRAVMVPMRDGVQLETTVLTPRGPTDALPIIVFRTPYGVPSCPVRMIQPFFRELAADGYVFALQNTRGRGRSEGQFVMNQPLRPAPDAPGTDEATDAYDLVEWLLQSVPGNNGRVGVIGISYPGWLAEVVLAYPHPAVKAVSPQAPMTDTWMGDDFFHQGAFRMQFGFEYGWAMENRMAGLGPRSPSRYDAYDAYLEYPTLRDLYASTGADKMPTWQRFIAHPAYDSVWQARAFQRSVTGVSVPTMTVGGWWDQEDLFGPLATFTALERFDTAGVNGIVMGPWNHGGWGQPGGDSLGNLRFGEAVSDSFRLRVQAPWFAYWLKGRGDGRFPNALVFDAGINAWRTFDAWPPRDGEERKLYLREGGRIAWEAPTADSAYDEYVSDPAKPVPYRPRPIAQSGWGRWMTEDQRMVHGRPDVLSWETAPLTEDVTIAGDVRARLFASTTGSDADWVVKLIDVYPDSGLGPLHATRPAMRGYQLMVASDILRGRYRRSFERAEAIPPNTVQAYSVDLHQQSYTFGRGHRIMVQVQSTWFPLYDRNPQTFVPNIFEATAADFRAQTHRIWRSARAASHVEVRVVPGDAGRQR
jgi:putative CocE/NonD family hydrolase